MTYLPQELIDHISSFLPLSDLKNTLLVSRQFHSAAEKYSEAHTKYTLTTKSDAQHFVEKYSGRLFRLLRNVEIRTSVPDLDRGTLGNKYRCRDTAAELQEMDEQFTRQIRFFFSAIQKVEDKAWEMHGPGRIQLKIYTPTRLRYNMHSCFHRIYNSWRVHLLSPERLPALKSVRSLLVQSGEDHNYSYPGNPHLRKLDLRVLLDLSSKMPNLEILNCLIGGDEWSLAWKTMESRYTTTDWQGPRRDSRHDFGKALKEGTIALPNLRHAKLNFMYPAFRPLNIDQRLALPNLTQPAVYDPFSSSLRILSYQLRTMNLLGMVDASLFWPLDDNSTPYWPHLESISIMFHVATPSGEWYFEGPIHVDEPSNRWKYEDLPIDDDDCSHIYDSDSSEGEDWDEYSINAAYRLIPNETTLVPFLSTFAKAATLMPSLKQVALWTILSFNVDGMPEYKDFDISGLTACERTEDGNYFDWGVAYVKPGTRAFNTNPGENFSASRQLWWKVGKWRPSAELLNLFHNIGKQHGEDLVEYWDDAYDSDGLVNRDVFQAWRDAVFRE
ncbi:hypothetical protein P280DRAFT_461803 [Massarina eburnea CBS 473.64]|uniref:F-box domain-containing protein n=1 Tax=Massarina eburnea CBS 473.64 TaxID=1395130 RepID=A0A6A6RK12_9PLEO|nr:hypothetical protein P280DRAFT_461803 [Massarina eburnea CBS 473.64]